uniref:ATP synthase F0 subunit 8 n=1 Tax=Hydropuntia rangiferina TaxID=338881 RepID=A0A345UBC5_9FLOR|nr:ATP synthase F0 subunit 8 [Hydropuntia rangiferina]AXI97761.1 ATP synthase F0 subunit 8 [Hydropuntia rangiferina]UAD89787.1 ATP synthase F0 subunit 8 [Hydropuntia rangiferina]
MPQLDRIIVFSQIFWLFLIFSLFYIVLVHYFLPKFLKSLKLRKQIIDNNTQETLNKTNYILSKQILLKKVLLKNLGIVLNLLAMQSTQLIEEKKSFDTLVLDQKISIVILNTIKFCDSKVLNSIFIYSKLFNFKN